MTQSFALFANGNGTKTAINVGKQWSIEEE
jgi:hypothetical protein